MPSADENRLHAIVLAAGGSRRMGRPKQLIRIDEVPMVRLAAEAAAAVCPGRVFVVTGASAAAVRQALRACPVSTVHNAGWAAGLSSSIAAGIAALPAGTQAALVLSCDQPRVRIADLQGLTRAWRRQPDCPAAAEYDGVTGIPAILTADLFTRITQLRGDSGAGGLLRTLPALTRVAMPAAAFDLDDASDLARLADVSDVAGGRNEGGQSR